jgi:nicotinamidase-related amidase
MSYDPATTAILLVDPYNDFLSDGGKLWPRVKGVADDVGLLDHLREVISAARARGLKIFFVPHHRWKPGDYISFDNPSPYQLASAKGQVFAKDSWGGTFHDDFQPQPGDVVVQERRLAASAWSSGTTSPWSRTRPLLSAMKQCTPPMPSTGRPMLRPS